jgi:ribosomal protein L3 glutamine methyltransferase
VEIESDRQLVTVRDWLRHAVSCFRAAGLCYGHGTANAFDEAAYLILDTLHLPIDQLEPWLDARLLMTERQAVRRIIEQRIATRKPASYLTNEAWIQGHSFYVDQRVIVPRSYIGELLGAGLDQILEQPDCIGRVLDLCTGSGCLAILAALAFPNAAVDASDISVERSRLWLRVPHQADAIRLVRQPFPAAIRSDPSQSALCSRRCRRSVSTGALG